MRAEIKAGELLAQMKECGERDTGKGNRNPFLKLQAATPKLSDLGVTKTQSSRWQKLAALSPDEQEAKITLAKQKAEAAVDGVGRSQRRQPGGKQGTEQPQYDSRAPAPAKSDTDLLVIAWDSATIEQQRKLIKSRAPQVRDLLHLHDEEQAFARQDQSIDAAIKRAKCNTAR